MAYLEFQPTNTVYHYSSVDGFMGIMRSKSLWFSDLSASNDPRELHLGLGRIIRVLESIKNNEYRGDDRPFLATLTDHMSKLMERGCLYCCCFSELADELPMWREYGANYGGLAIGFKPTALFGINARVQKVKYVDDAEDKDLRALMLDIVREAAGINLPPNAAYWVFPSTAATAVMTSLKHFSWAYEREVRIIHGQPRQKLDAASVAYMMRKGLIGGPLPWTKPLERPGRTGNVTYLAFEFGRKKDGKMEAKGAIDEIIVGPNCPLSLNDVEKVMTDNGFEGFKVRKSHCQIR